MWTRWASPVVPRWALALCPGPGRGHDGGMRHHAALSQLRETNSGSKFVEDHKAQAQTASAHPRPLVRSYPRSTR